MHPLQDDIWFNDKLNIVDINHPVRNCQNVEYNLSQFIDFVGAFFKTYNPVQLYSTVLESTTVSDTQESTTLSTTESITESTTESTTESIISLSSSPEGSSPLKRPHENTAEASSKRMRSSSDGIASNT
jgi:hypothetical protein